jgi:hypothetical protein
MGRLVVLIVQQEIDDMINIQLFDNKFSELRSEGLDSGLSKKGLRYSKGYLFKSLSTLRIQCS